MGVSVASIKTTSNAWSLAATALRPGNRKGFAFGQRVFAPFDVAVRRALADPVGLPDMKIGPVFAPIFKHHQKLIFDAERVGLATGRLLLAFGVRKHRRHRFKCVPLNTGKPPEYLTYQLFDRIKSHRRLPLAATNQTGVKRRLCKRSINRRKLPTTETGGRQPNPRECRRFSRK